MTKQNFLVVDESTLSGIQYLNSLVESLETLHISYWYDCQSLPCAHSSSSIAQAVDDTARSLETKLFCQLFSSAARYTVAASSTLKSLYPKVF